MPFVHTHILAGPSCAKNRRFFTHKCNLNDVPTAIYDESQISYVEHERGRTPSGMTRCTCGSLYRVTNKPKPNNNTHNFIINLSCLAFKRVLSIHDRILVSIANPYHLLPIQPSSPVCEKNSLSSFSFLVHHFKLQIIT